MTDLEAMTAGTVENPTAYPILCDLLRERGRWDWPTVNRLVCAYPAADWPRLMAATWLEEYPDGPCGRCEGREGMNPCSGCGGRGPIYRDGHGIYPCPECGHMESSVCFDCHGTGRVPTGNRDRAEFVRCQVELVRLGNCACGMTGRKPLDGPPHCCPTCGRLRRREGELLTEHWKAWAGPWEGDTRFCLNLTTPETPLGPGDFAVRFHRGFLAEVHAPLAALLGGGECPGCSVCAGPSSRRVARPLCGGTGHAPGVLPALVATHPLVRVEFTDREPLPAVGHGPPHAFSWYFADQDPAAGWWLPLALAEHFGRPLDRGPGLVLNLRPGEGFLSYPTRAAALDALSTAALLLVRAPEAPR